MISPLPGELIRLEAGFIIFTGCHCPATICQRQAIDRLPGSRRRPVIVCRHPALASHRTAYVYG